MILLMLSIIQKLYVAAHKLSIIVLLYFDDCSIIYFE